MHFPSHTYDARSRGEIASLTVVVCTRDRPVLLEQCLGALAAQTYPDFDVLVVDNGPSPAVRELCRRWSATWVPAPIPGLTVARNIGARRARGELVAYIDDDAIPEAGWLEALVEDFNDPAVAAVSGRVRYMDSIGDSRAMSCVQSPGASARPRRSFDAGTHDWFALACFGGIGDGGNMAFRRELIAAAPAFDERIGRGRLLDSGDEHIVFASLIARGFRVSHNPSAVVRHPSPSTEGLRQSRRYAELRSSIAHLLYVWGEFPRYRVEIVRFLGRAIARRIAPRAGAGRAAAGLPGTNAIRAACEGVGVYFKARREWAGLGNRVSDDAHAASGDFAEPSSR